MTILFQQEVRLILTALFVEIKNCYYITRRDCV